MTFSGARQRNGFGRQMASDGGAIALHTRLMVESFRIQGLVGDMDRTGEVLNQDHGSPCNRHLLHLLNLLLKAEHSCAHLLGSLSLLILLSHLLIVRCHVSTVSSATKWHVLCPGFC